MATIVRFIKEGCAKSVLGSTNPLLRDFQGKAGQVLPAAKGRDRHIYVGVGKEADVRSVKIAIRAAMKCLRDTKSPSATVVIPKWTVKTKLQRTADLLGANQVVSCSTAQLISQWSEAAQYDFDRYKRVRLTPTKLRFVSDRASETATLQTSVRRGIIVGQSVNIARELGNLRPDVCSPAYFAKFATRIATKSRGKFKLRVVHNLGPNEMTKRGLNLLHAVGKGSQREPRLLVLEYVGNKASKSTTAIVGKGVTMDTGGLNVKPFGSMETMHMDMMGAAAVIGTANAISLLQLPINFVAVVPLAENAIGHKSYMPSTIIRSLKGATVEVTNTDAEGRLILADALTFVQDHASISKKVTSIVDIATLTGAVVAALGDRHAGIFCNDAQLRTSLMQAGVESDERLWPLPIADEHDEKVKGLMSDLINCTADRYAGASTAGAFLKHFVNDGVAWAHLDVAGPAMGTKATATNPAGAPGFGVELLVRYFEKLGKQ